MSTLTSYIIFWMILFVLLGAFWYVIDRHYGVKWYRRWYRLTRPEPLAEDVVAGFVFNRRTRHKALMAAILSTVQTVVALIQIENLNLLVELILWIVEVPMTLIGFAVGPWAYRLWRRKDAVFDKIDEWEQGGAKQAEKEENAERTASDRGRVGRDAGGRERNRTGEGREEACRPARRHSPIHRPMSAQAQKSTAFVDIPPPAFRANSTGWGATS